MNTLAYAEDKTRITAAIPACEETPNSSRGDCLVIIYSKHSSHLGKRYVLEASPTFIGRGYDNHIVLESDSVSRRHCSIEQRENKWFLVDSGSTNGTYMNDESVTVATRLQSGDRVKVGPVILKYLSGNDVETLYHEEIYRITILDGLTQAYNKRHFFEMVEKEVTRARRYARELSCILFDIDHFKQINDRHGHLAGDYILKELAQVVQARLRGEEIFARYGGEEFCILAPETSLEGACILAEDVRRRVQDTQFVFQGKSIACTISLGVAFFSMNDQDSNAFIQRADEQLYLAKRLGRNRIAG